MTTRRSLPALAAAVIAIAIAVPYALLIDPTPVESARSAFVTACLAAAGGLAFAGGLRLNGRLRAACLGAACGLLFGWGILGLASIGLPLLVAAVLALISASAPPQVEGGPFATAFLSAVGVVGIGLAVT